MSKRYFSRLSPVVLSVFVLTLCFPSLLHSQVANISPPTMSDSPIYEGTEIVGIVGKAGYRISVYANGAFVGQGKLPPWGWGPVRLDRPLKEDEVITATQSNNGDTGHPTWSKHAVTVEKVPFESLIHGEKFYPPKVVGPLYQCQECFWVEGLIEGVQVNDELLNPVRESVYPWTPYQHAFVGVRAPRSLEENQTVRASQSFPSWPFPQKSDPSPAVTVQAPPSLNDKKYKPVIVTDTDGDGVDDLSVGTTILVVDNTITGAKVRIYAVDPSTGNETDDFGVCVVGGDRSLVLLSKPLTTPHPIAQQWLCDDAPKSPPSDPVTLKPAIGLPEIEQPICEGAVEVTVLKTEPWAEVDIEVKPKSQTSFEGRGGKTASGTTTTVQIGGGVPLSAGDEVRVRQRNAILESNWTAPVPVSGPQTQPVVEVRNGFQHQAVPGNVPVFYRGVLTSGKYGPGFRVVMCGAKRAIVRIIAPLAEGFQEIEVVELTETKVGYFEGGWDWNHAGWTIPDDIPIGEYTARFVVTSSTGTSQKDEIFFVAFDPEEVRKNIVAATSSFKGIFPRISDPWINGTNLNESQVNKYFTGSPSDKIDCYGAALVVMARGLIMTLESGDFDKLGYTSSRRDMHLEYTSPIANIGQMKNGDWGYIKNDESYLDKHPCGAMQGENVIKVSASKYWGFDIGEQIYNKWEKDLIDAYNNPPTSCDRKDSRYDSELASKQINSIPGFLGDKNKFFDIIRISWDVWQLRKP